MKKLLALCLLFMLSFGTVTVSAGNDGNALLNPFGDCGASASFGGDAKYYDFLIPYNMSIGQIGGYCNECTFSANSAYKGWDMVTSGDALNKRVGQFNVQGKKSSTWIGCTVKVDPNTNFQYVEKDGCQFYIASLPKAVFNYSAVTSGGFYQWAYLGRTGIIYDMILKDGTVIHFATGDGIGVDHSNNPSNYQTSGQDGVYMKFADLKYTQYANLFHASKPNHTFECFVSGSGAISKFKSYYGISDSNPVVAIRMWNKSIKDGGIKVNPGFSGLSSKGNVIDGTVTAPGTATDVVVGPTTPGNNVNSSTSTQFVSGSWSELDLSVYQALSEPNLEETLLNQAQHDNLGQKDLEGLTNWERNHAGNLKENGYIATLRWVVVIVGILMTIWALFAYLAFWFDHINSFVYLDALHILTFGQLHICPPGEKPTFSLGKKVKDKTVSHWQMVCICMTAILFGSMLISGVFYNAVNRLVHLILSFIH